MVSEIQSDNQLHDFKSDSDFDRTFSKSSLLKSGTMQDDGETHQVNNKTSSPTMIGHDRL